ncbi:duf1740 domain containing protein [Grosmannia clavigera kw1407]|uniref:Duf1740 domain containing protein n=1 Tax=Grosmannia clavigera (strain kw1407 / UAMH 11150) TaxID=655863 RepID=F0XQ00_GROCL|nr:duf1740 domain containing protein [Grosmannia clavigera kw1407]EFX00619.1 duf1740 domain containing protein [Grosmannia clavigera kw1407]
MASSRHAERGGRTVPSFVASAEARDDERERRRSQSRREDRHHHHHHRHHHRSRDERDFPGRRPSHREDRKEKSSSGRRERGRETRHSRPEGHEGRAKGESSRDADSTLFTADTRGDPLIWQFGANDRRRVPVYSRFREGRSVLGAESRFRFSHEGAQEFFFVAPPTDGGVPILRDKSHPLLVRAMAASAAKAPRPPAGGSADVGSFGSDFVPLRASRKRKRSSGSTDNDSDSGQLSDSTSSSSSDMDEEDDDDVDDGDDDFVASDAASEQLKHQMVELSRRVKEQPGDVDAWLELVDLQDQQRRLLGNSDLALGGSRRAPSQDEIAGVAKVKLSMLESALKGTTAVVDRERLQLAAMRERAKMDTPKQLAQRWQDLAADSPGGALGFALWRARLDFEMTSLSSFTVDGLRAFLEARLRHMEDEAKAVAAADEKNSMDTQLVEIYGQMVYVFLRATRFLYDAGFSNLATAAWQALLESTFARPSETTADTGLGAFWDSEVRRIGEDGAQGWRCFAADVTAGKDVDSLLPDGDGQVQLQVLPTIDLDRIVDGEDAEEQLSVYKAWVTVERQRAALSRLPARLTDDVDDDGYDDVFRTIVFADMESLLFTVPLRLTQSLQPLLVDAFLVFCQLPPAFATSSWIEAARNDPFLAIVYLGSDRPDADLLTDVGGRRPPDLACDGSRVAVSAELLFAQPEWFCYLPDWLRQPDGDNRAPVPPRWVANTLRQLVRSFGVENLAAYSLAVDAAVQPDHVKKAARALLKQYRTNTALYNAYALAELSRGHGDVARSVLSPAVAASAAASPPDVEAEMTLRQTWAWMELEAGHKNAAVRRLLPTDAVEASDDNDIPISPSQLLRARRAMHTEMDYGLSMGHIDRATLFAESSVLLEFLCATEDRPTAARSTSRQGNLAAALTASAAFSDEMLARGHGQTAAHERLLQWTSRVLYFHASHGPYRPAELQAPLRRFVELFPRNGLFLRLFAWIDPASASGLSRLRPDDPVRQILDTVVLTRAHDCPSSRAFAVRFAGGTSGGRGDAHAVQTAFAQALVPPDGTPTACQDSAALWQAYVHVTAVAALTARRSRGRLDRKDVLLQAFGPATALVATSAATAGAAMTPAELRAVFHTIVTEGLRVHVDLGLVLERAGQMAEQRRAAAGRGRQNDT